MTDDLASGWPARDAPPPPGDVDDPGPDPGIDLDAILRRLESAQTRPAASPARSVPALIPATPPSAWSTGPAAGAAGPPTEAEISTPSGRDIPHPTANADRSIRGVGATIARDSITVAGLPVVLSEKLRTRESLPDEPIPSPEINSPGRETADAVARPGAWSPATSIARLRLEPPSHDLGLGAPARTGSVPEAASTPVPTGRGAGAGDDAGFAGSRQGVSPEDLLKTNELLRQLVEETRRLRVASLPAASPPAYPAR